MGRLDGKPHSEASLRKCVGFLTVWPSQDIAVKGKGIRETNKQTKHLMSQE